MDRTVRPADAVAMEQRQVIAAPAPRMLPAPVQPLPAPHRSMVPALFPVVTTAEIGVVMAVCSTSVRRQR